MKGAALTGKRRYRVWRRPFRNLRIVLQVEVAWRVLLNESKWATRTAWRDAHPDDVLDHPE